MKKHWKSIEKRKLGMLHREGFLRVNICILYSTIYKFGRRV